MTFGIKRSTLVSIKRMALDEQILCLRMKPWSSIREAMFIIIRVSHRCGLLCSSSPCPQKQFGRRIWAVLEQKRQSGERRRKVQFSPG